MAIHRMDSYENDNGVCGGVGGDTITVISLRLELCPLCQVPLPTSSPIAYIPSLSNVMTLGLSCLDFH